MKALTTWLLFAVLLASSTSCVAQRNKPPKVVYIHDTVRVTNTVVRRDTIRITNTVTKRDTVILQVPKLIHDTLRITVTQTVRDTVTLTKLLHDTLRITKLVHDTLLVRPLPDTAWKTLVDSPVQMIYHYINPKAIAVESFNSVNSNVNISLQLVDTVLTVDAPAINASPIGIVKIGTRQYKRVITKTAIYGKKESSKKAPARRRSYGSKTHRAKV
jgi:hypothetical protein